MSRSNRGIVFLFCSIAINDGAISKRDSAGIQIIRRDTVKV